MIKGTTSKGFAFEINESVLDDWEILELFEDVEDNNPVAVVKLAKSILGLEQYKNLKESLRGENGKVSMIDMSDAIMEIFNSDQETKN